MYIYHYSATDLAHFSQIPADTLRTWQRAENRKTHCALIEAAYQRSLQDFTILELLHQEGTLQNFADSLGFHTPYLPDMGVPQTTLRQWEKDGDGFRVRICLVGHQTLRIQEATGSINIQLDKLPISSAQMMRLLTADQDATLILLRHFHYNPSIKS